MNVVRSGVTTPVCTACFTVVPKPTIVSMTPVSRVPGASHVAVTVSGAGFQPGATVAFGAGVTVHSVTVNSASTIVTDISVDPAATLGTRPTTVTNPDGGTATKATGFAVSAPPTVTSLTPTRLRQGQVATVRVDGTGFAVGASASFGEGVTVTSVTRNSATRLTVAVSVDPAAAAGIRSAEILNPDGGRVTCVDCLQLVANPTIEPAGVDPSALGQGVTGRTATVRGTGFLPGATVKFGSGITVNATTYVDATTLTAQITVGGTATPGTRDVTVTNPDSGLAVCRGMLRRERPPDDHEHVADRHPPWHHRRRHRQRHRVRARRDPLLVRHRRRARR